MRITDTGEVVPSADNTGSVGTVAKRGGLIRGAVITPSDLVFENGYHVIEDSGSGLMFLNQKGERIVKLDEQGNLWRAE